MITPKLEELILCGKAFFKTFVAGGDKHTLNIGNDRFIIIIDITYFPMNILTSDGVTTYQNHNTQVAIYGERGYNHYIFRNHNDAINNATPRVTTPNFIGPTTINTYLLHEQQVGFSFCNAPFFQNQFMGIADTENPGYPNPIEWGIDGQNNSITTLTMDAVGAPVQNDFTVRPAIGNNESTQLFFPFQKANNFGDGNGVQTNFENKYEFPLLLVNYVEVIGSANNIQI